MTAHNQPYSHLDDTFFSPAEAGFYRLLEQTAGRDLLIFPKVRLADLLAVFRPQIDDRQRSKYGRLQVDFLLCSPETLQPLFGIELDEPGPARRERDDPAAEAFAAAGLPLLRVPLQDSYDLNHLAALFHRAQQRG